MRDIESLSAPVDATKSGLEPGTVVSGGIQERNLAGRLAQQFRALNRGVRMEEYPVRAYRYGVPEFIANSQRVPAIALQATAAVWGSRDGVSYSYGNEQLGRRMPPRPWYSRLY